MKAIGLLVVVAACGGGQHTGDDEDLTPDAAIVGEMDGSATRCAEVTDQVPASITAPGTGEYVLQVTASSSSPTSWGEAGNEAVVLEVDGAHGLIGHLILHQGKTPFAYDMHVGALDAGEPLTFRVSSLSAPHAIRGATVCDASAR